jgi:hypothetical protein
MAAGPIGDRKRQAANAAGHHRPGPGRQERSLPDGHPILAEAVRGFPTLLRFQALECLCPLTNVRLLGEGSQQFAQ